MVHGCAVRFIRARAETTWRSAACPSPSSVHPRPRGDDSSRVTRSKFATGSSAPARRRRTPCSAAGGRSPVHPRPRGDDGVDATGDARPRRFIRARAETTSPGHEHGTWRPVHPRPRGDDSPLGGPGGSALGSSAPARRRLRAFRDLARGQRFIRARAETTVGARGRPGGSGVHPRPRGDDVRREGPHRLVLRFIRARAETTAAWSTISTDEP